MKQITNENFKSSTIANKMVIIKLGAPWCSPCHALQPILEAVDKENKDITVFDVDVDEEIELTEELEIRSVPTLLFYKDGNLIERISGTKTKEQILSIFAD